MTRRKRHYKGASYSQQYKAIGGLLSIFSGFEKAQQQAELAAARKYKIQLDSYNAYLKAATIGNQAVLQDIKIEKEKVRLERERLALYEQKRKLGLTGTIQIPDSEE